MRTSASLGVLALVALAPSLAAAQPPNRVYVGAYLTDVSDFDLKAGRFKADLRVWLKWLGTDDVPDLTFENGEIESKDELGKEHDGAWHSVQYRVQGTFRGEFPVHDFPFDRQTLPVVFGLEQAGGQLVPDLGASGMSPGFSVTGWLYEPFFNARTEVKTFGSDLGSVDEEGKSTVLPRVAFTVELRRPIAPYMLKFVLPLALILLMALLALFLPAETLEVRSAMGVTSLLSCIAFHYSQSDTLPNVSYLVAADLLFLGAYTFVTATLLISVVTYRLHSGQATLAQRVDRAGIVGLPSVTVVLLIALVQVFGRSHAIAAPMPEPHATQPRLTVGAFSLDTIATSGGPQRRSFLVVRGADGTTQPSLVEEAPSMTNQLVRLLPDGGMRVRWRLVPNARWSDGRPVTLDDLLFSVNSVTSPLRTAVEAIDERTVDVTYSQRRKEFLEGLVLFPRAALEPVFADGGREAMSRAAVEASAPTAAAYRVRSYAAGKSLSLERNESFGGARPTFDAIEVVKVDPKDAAQALTSHAVDVLPVLDAKTYAALQHDPRVKVLEQPGDTLWVLVPNLTEPPWNELAARRALLSAIDRDALAKLFEPEPVHVASGWRAGFHAPSLPRYTPQAQAALAALGLEGAHLTLHTGSLAVKDGPLARVAEKLMADFVRAGLEVEVVEHQEIYPLLQKGGFEGLVLASRDTADAARFLNVPFSGGHFDVEHVHGAHFDEAMKSAYERFASSLYDERRAALEQGLQALWAERLPTLPLVLTSRLSAVRADLVGPKWGLSDSLYWNVGDWRFETAARAR